jgi:flagellar biosynthesis/type III secretory pathway protein FliH
MLREIAIPFKRPLRRVVAEDASAPLSTGPDPELLRREEERRRQEQQREEERQRLAAVLAGLTGAARSLEAEHRRRWQEMELAAVELAVAIASRLLHQRLNAGEFGVEALAREVLGRLEGGQQATVFLHPDDLALLRQRLPDEAALASDHRPVRLAADPALRRGDCRAQAGEVSVLSQVEGQLADLHRHLQRSVLNESGDA